MKILAVGNLIVESLCLLRCFNHYNKTSQTIIKYLKNPVCYMIDLMTFLLNTPRIEITTQDTSRFYIYKLTDNEWIVSGNQNINLTSLNSYIDLLNYFNSMLSRTVTAIYYNNGQQESQALWNSNPGFSQSPKQQIRTYLMDKNVQISQQPIDINEKSLALCKCPENFVDIVENATVLLHPLSPTLPSTEMYEFIRLILVDNSEFQISKTNKNSFTILNLSNPDKKFELSSKDFSKKFLNEISGKLAKIEIYTGLTGCDLVEINL